MTSLLMGRLTRVHSVTLIRLHRHVLDLSLHHTDRSSNAKGAEQCLSQSLRTRLTKCVSADRDCSVTFLKPIFLLDCADFSSNKIYDVLILPRGYQADHLCMSMTSVRLFTCIFFPQTIWIYLVQTAHQVQRYSCIRAYMCVPR